ncbi:patatin-like phospholipase family protein [Geobacter sp. AOG1]|uniref:patatin-like phospholipase family protein n=1 Tax=Geobacter sp. AOG1 TaxID=1566346 RepID=UPI001CC4EBAE|nr:patatin-like phospholipase family protein [Geobacter sp. AOG1]GFE56267.1 hypothetical protein AOG1_01450 [Geobacter sp. AOG1]
MRIISQAAAMAILFCLASGCATVHHEREGNISGIFGNCSSACRSSKEARSDLYRKNQEILGRKYKEERSYLARKYPHDVGTKGAEPRIGLALSGGGPRSASFTMGVLKALDEKGVMDRLDVISSVSGGSYAMYWYFSQNCYLNTANNEDYCPLNDEITSDEMARLLAQRKTFDRKGLFASKEHNLNDPKILDEYRFQISLEERSDILTSLKEQGTWGKLLGYGEVAYKGSVYSLSLPFHWIFNGLFDMNMNLNPSRWYYQNGIERTYGYVPLSYDLEKFANNEKVLFQRKAVARQVKFSQLRDYVSNPNKKYPMPYFIINSTGGYDRGYDVFGDGKYRQMHKAIFEFTPWLCGSDLFGYREAEECEKEVSFSRAISISGAAVDGQQEAIDLAGVGIGESKATSTAMNIFNLDLGYRISNPNTNPVVRFLHWLTPFPLYFVADLIQGDRTSGIRLSDGGHSDNLGVFSLVRRGTKKIIAVDAEQDQKSVFEAAHRLGVQLEKELGLKLSFDKPDKVIDVYNTPLSQAVIRGKISGMVDENGDDAPIELIYIKLSLDRQLVKVGDQGYPFSIIKYQEKDPLFPHDPTFDLFYSPEQYKAYRDLGYMLGNSYEKYGEFMQEKPESR